MRVLKFRAWDKDLKRMSKPFKLGDFAIFWNDDDTPMPLEFGISKGRLVIQQSLDLPCANKPHKDIFEGDIVKAGACKGYIHYSNGAYWIIPGKAIEGDAIVIDNTKDSPLFFEAWALLAGDIRILGNIFETPESIN